MFVIVQMFYMFTMLTSMYVFYIFQVNHSSFPFTNQGSVVGGPAQTTPEDTDLALANSASLQTAPNTYTGSGPSTSTGAQNTESVTHNGKGHDVASSSTPAHYHPHTETNTYSQIVPTAPIAISPSAPPVSEMVGDGPIHSPLNGNFGFSGEIFFSPRM